MENIKRVKLACYTSNLSMSVVSNLSPLLFIAFRDMYGISYSLLGLLVLVNFFTQLTVDLLFSFFSHKFNLSKCVKLIPCITLTGFIWFALSPFIFGKYVYIGLLTGTMIFAASGGFVEVLLSPVIAALPAKDPDREMSKLHSVYAWGVVGMILAFTLFVFLFGVKYWYFLVLAFSVVPLSSMLLFAGAELPDIQPESSGDNTFKRTGVKTLALCVICIFLGGAAECTMAQWCSGYIEAALSVPKAVGDIFGVALFSVMLGLGRTLYSKYGKNIDNVLILGSFAATLCYVLAATISIPALALVFCALTGFCTSMLWPGNLISVTDKLKGGGVMLFALMAAGGDLGAATVPALVGMITDSVMTKTELVPFADSLGLSLEQLGMKTGMLIGALFPFMAMFIHIYLKHRKKTHRVK